jgi:hypothetical protein
VTAKQCSGLGKDHGLYGDSIIEMILNLHRTHLFILLLIMDVLLAKITKVAAMEYLKAGREYEYLKVA